ncbi:MAG: hypothetical protein P8O20_07320, partial [Bacteroidia bacterium]|nr:hypothetical protein [Bacteroidia bacterium]
MSLKCTFILFTGLLVISGSAQSVVSDDTTVSDTLRVVEHEQVNITTSMNKKQIAAYKRLKRN